MTNLLTETIEDIRDSGHTPEEIVFIGSERSGHQCTWGEFQELANQEYDNGFGAAEVATDLIIVFTDGTKLWRHEYDGSESWEYSTPFVRPTGNLPIKRLIGNYWPSLEQLQDDSDDHHNPGIVDK